MVNSVRNYILMKKSKTLHIKTIDKLLADKQAG
jgi:hypothetical protein